MAWTYDGRPDISAIDRVRLAIGDTIESDPLLTDEEITGTIALYPDDAISRCAMAVAMKFSRLADVAVGDARTQYQSRAAQYSQMAQDIRNDTRTSSSALLCIIPASATTDDETPIFKVGMMNG